MLDAIETSALTNILINDILTDGFNTELWKIKINGIQRGDEAIFSQPYIKPKLLDMSWADPPVQLFQNL